jgi:hypothetical protein
VVDLSVRGTTFKTKGFEIHTRAFPAEIQIIENCRGDYVRNV